MELLGTRIIDGTLAPGDVLNLQQLGEELDLSMTSLREAIKVLMAKGLLDARQKRGTFVKPRREWNALDADVIRWRQNAGESAGVLRDLAEVRRAIEPKAAALAAQRRSEGDVDSLRQALKDMAAAHPGPAAEAARADVAFHQVLLEATGNELLGQMGLFVEPALMVRDQLIHDHPVPDPVPAHQKVVEAIVQGNPDEAAAATHALLEQSAEDATRVLGENGATS